MAKISCDKVIEAINGRLQDMDGDDLAQAYAHISGHDAKCLDWEKGELMMEISLTDNSLGDQIP